ncbi:MAG: sodium-dependent transporter [Bacteroidales bacterium]|jgi:NSS family neurotransmitter:Na+ symporter|nr:sodium-dependent transporter [Bacteroidales bacterium]MCI2121945.1 sodium-dependent transporter [Bacteroidales bacterium]MCI2144982.1 sodium-dependent transporter [Bacteroidales bacterium]
MGERDNFSNRFGALVALIGSAVGLGNLWRFPYLVGRNGGAAFIIIYICIVLVICLPLMLCEMVVGRRSKSNVFGAFRKLAPGSHWNIIGILAVLSAVTILSFYSVVGGWTLAYLVKSLGFGFHAVAKGDGAAFSGIFKDFVTSPVQPLLYTLAFMAITGFVVIFGVNRGIEKTSKWMMPIMLVMIVGIVIWSMTLPGSSAGFRYLFKPDFSHVGWNTVLAALGQAFFSLSLGAGTIMTYASYIRKDENILRISAGTVLGDTVFAILAGCAIMPAVFSYGVSPAQGPGLVFVVLPNIFANMPMGSIIAIMFFIILFFAAITSSISLMEVPVAFLIEECHMKRKTAVLVSFVSILALGCVCSLSQGVLGGVKIFGKSIFDFFDFMSANIFMTIGGLLLVIFVGWKLGKAAFKDEMTNGGRLHGANWLLDFFFFIIKFAAPAVIAVIFFTNLI